jgi:hypothetical protein
VYSAPVASTVAIEHPWMTRTGRSLLGSVIARSSDQVADRWVESVSPS